MRYGFGYVTFWDIYFAWDLDCFGDSPNRIAMIGGDSSLRENPQDFRDNLFLFLWIASPCLSARTRNDERVEVILLFAKAKSSKNFE